MKICHVSFGEIKGATAAKWLNSVPYFTKVLTEMARDHDVFSFHYSSAAETQSIGRVEYYFLETSLREKIFVSDMVHSVRRLKPEVIILHGFHSALTAFRFISKMKGYRIFVQHHGEKTFRFPKSIFQKLADKAVSGYFFSSRELASGWVRSGLIANYEKIHEVMEITSSFPVQKSQSERKQNLNFIWVGRLDENKDPFTMIDGFVSFLKTYPNANLYMIFNQAELLSQVRARIEGFQSSIHLVGAVPHSQMPEWYAKCDFIVSTSFFEAAGVSVLEGIACGCIPVLSDIPSFRKILDEGKIGVVFSKHSSHALENALRKAAALIVHEERQKVLTHFENNLSPVAIANQLVNNFKNVIQIEKSSVWQ